MHTQNNPFFILYLFRQVPPEDPQLSVTAVHLINCNCSDIKAPVTLSIVSHLLVKHTFAVFIREIQVAHTHQKGSSIVCGALLFGNEGRLGRDLSAKKTICCF